MPVTEFSTFELVPPHTLDTPPLLKILLRLCMRQAAHSSYPLTFYADVTSSSTIYLVSGWRSVQAHQRWLASDENRELGGLLQPFALVKARLRLEMDFDSIPRRILGVLCLTLSHFEERDSDEEVDDAEGVGDFEKRYHSDTRIEGSPLTISWTGGGILSSEINSFYRFILYAGDASEGCIRRKHRPNEVIIMRRISISR